MRIEELKTELEKKIAEIKQKIEEIQHGIEEEDAPSPELEDTLVQLKAIQEDLILQYDQLVALEEEGEKYNELERNIWTNLESFDSKFSNAGSIMKGSKFRDRNRTIDFKNPQDTK
jgi:chromosome segregation ATPase